MTPSSSRPRPVIEWDHATFAYGEAIAVEDVSLSVHEGELAAVLGPNGGGKSTLIRMALGLLRPTSGAVRLFGRDAADFGDWDRVGYMPQVFAGAWRDFPGHRGRDSGPWRIPWHRCAGAVPPVRTPGRRGGP